MFPHNTYRCYLIFVFPGQNSRAQMQQGMPDGLPAPVDPAAAVREVDALFRAGEDRIGVDTSEFVRVFATSSREMLLAIADEYARNHKHTLDQACERELPSTGDLREGCISIRIKSPNTVHCQNSLLSVSLCPYQMGNGTDEGCFSLDSLNFEYKESYEMRIG